MSDDNSTTFNFLHTFNYFFNLSTSGILTIVGIIGNSLVLFIFRRKQFRDISMFRYYSFLVALETVEIPLIWIYYFPKIFLFNKIEIICKLLQFFSSVLAVFATLMPVVISVDRFVNVKYPRKFQYMNEFKFQLSVVVGLLICSSVISFPLYYYNELYSFENITQCNYADNPWTGMQIDISFLVISVFIPISISITFSILTVYQLIHSKKRLSTNNDFKKEKKLLKILISMDIFNLVCNFPFAIYTLLNDIFILENYYPAYTMTIFYDISNFLFYSNQSLSFFVYFLSNQQLRNFFFQRS